MIYGIIISETAKDSTTARSKVRETIRKLDAKDKVFLTTGATGLASYAARSAQELHPDANHRIIPPGIPRPDGSFEFALKRSGILIQFAPNGKTPEKSLANSYKLVAGVADRVLVFSDEDDSQDSEALSAALEFARSEGANVTRKRF